MQRFWDARAEENPWWFIDTQLDYARPDEERFWRNGEAALDLLLGAVGTEQPKWLGSAVELGALEDAVRAGGMELERVENPGTAMCFVRTRRR